MTSHLRLVNPEPEKLLTVAEVAERLSLGLTTVYELAHRGELEAHRIGTGGRDRRGVVRISERSVAALLERSRLGPKAR